MQNQFAQSLYACLNYEVLEPHYSKIASLTPGAIIGTLISFEQTEQPNTFLIDESAVLTIYCKGLTTFQ